MTAYIAAVSGIVAGRPAHACRCFELNILEANLVLSEQRRLAIWPPVRKRKIGRRAGIELVRVTNRVSEFFAYVRRADVRAGLPFIDARVTGQCGFAVELAKAKASW